MSDLRSGNDPTYLHLIEHQHKYLCALRDDGRTPELELLQDIAVYEFILHHDDPNKAADSYMEYKYGTRESLSKMQVAAALGWEIQI